MIDDPATISTTMIQKASSWVEANMLEMIRTRSGSSHSTEASIATVVIADTATEVHDLPTPRAMNNRTTSATTAIVQPSRTPDNNAPLQEKEGADEAAFPEEALASASASATTTTYGDIAYRNDIESKMSTLSACSTPESLTSYEVENTSVDQSVILNEIALINISQSASTSAQQQLVAATATAAAAAFDAAAPYVENSSNNDNKSSSNVSNANNSVTTNKSNKSKNNNNDIIVQTVGCGNRTVTLIQSPVSSATARSIKSSSTSSRKKGSSSSVNSSSHRGTHLIQSPGSITQSKKSSPVGQEGGREGSITRSIKSCTNQNQENVIIDEERDDNATTTTTAVLIINTTANEEVEQDQRQTNNNDDDEMSVELLSIATQPTMLSHIVSPNNPSCATSPTSYTTPIGGTTTGDEDRTVITTQPLLVEQHASVAENNEVEVQYTKGPGKKVKLSRKSKNILFNPFKSSSSGVSGGSGGVKDKSTITAVVAETKKQEKKKKVTSSNQSQQDQPVILSNNVSSKQHPIMQSLVGLVDSASFSPANVNTTISEDNIEVQACFGDDDKSSHHEQRGSSHTCMLVNTATVSKAALLHDVLKGGHNEHIQDEVVPPATTMSMMERVNSGSIHSPHSVSSSSNQHAAELESLHSTAVVVTNSPSLPTTHNKFTSPLIRGISLQKAKLFKRISSSTMAVMTNNSELVDECTNSPKKVSSPKASSPKAMSPKASSPKASSPKAKLLKSFGRFTKKSSSKRMTKVKSAPLVKLETVLESVAPETVLESIAPLPECQPELRQPNEVAKTSDDDNLIIPEEEMPDSSTLENSTQEALRATKSIERKQSPPRDDGLNMAKSVELLASCDGSFSHSSIKSVAFVSVATDLEDNDAPEQKTDHTDGVIATAMTTSDDNIYQAQIPSKSISSDGPTTVVDHEPEAVHHMNEENESSHDNIISYPLLIIQKTTSSTVNTSEQESDASGRSGKKQARMFMSKNMSKKAITSASARLSGYFNKKGKGKPLVESSTHTSDKSPGSTFTDTQEAVSNSTDDAAGDTEPQINFDVSNGEVNDACKLATPTTPEEGFVTKQENDERNNQSNEPRKLAPDDKDKSLKIPPMHAPEAKLYHALSVVKEKAEIAFTKREYASQKLVEKNTLEEELSSLLTTMMSSKGGDLKNQNQATRMISKLQTKVDHARAEHAKAELASILAMAEATKARDDAKCALDGLSKKDRKKNRKKVRIEEDGGDDDEEDMSIDFLDSLSTENTMDSGIYSEQAEKNWLLDSEFMRYLCCNGRDDFTMASVDITHSLIGISHESSEIKESEYRIRDDTSLLDLIVL